MRDSNAIRGLAALALAFLLLQDAASAALAADEDDKKELKQAANDLRQIVIAMYNYNDAMQKLPSPGYTKEEPDNPDVLRLLSWRVALLPYIEQADVYTAILCGKFGKPNPKNLGEFWNNADLLKKRPQLFAGGKTIKDATKTSWRVFVGNGAAFEKDKPLGIADIAKGDGTSYTILVVEAADPVPWTKCDELQYDPKKPLPRLGGRFKEGFLVGMADGTVRIIPHDTDEKIIRAMITRAGGEKIDKLPGREVK
jgi:hypothetical protein